MTTTTPSLTPIPPLTPQEQEEQNRLQNVIAATNQNLDEAEKEVNGIVYTPRWSDVVWVEPDSLAVLVAYCLPGEFAESGQEILGGFELEVLESYEVALPQNFMAWMMVIGNEDRQDRLPAAVGVICASDLNQPETRVLSPDEQQQINNVVQQFTTQVANIEQVINIINNVTGNATTGPVMPPPPTNDTGDNNIDTTPPSSLSILPRPTSLVTNDPEGARGTYVVDASDDVDGIVSLNVDNILEQDDIGGNIIISCDPPPNSLFPVGTTAVQCTAVDQAGNAATASVTITIAYRPPPGALQEEEQPPTPPAEEEEQQPPAAIEEEQPPPVVEEEAPVEEQQPPPAEEDEGAAASPPANDEGGG